MKGLPNSLRIALVLLLILLLVLGTAQAGRTQEVEQPQSVEEAPPPDLTPPVIEAPVNIVVTATDPGGAVVVYLLPVAADDIAGAVPVACDPGPGVYFSAGDTLITCWAQDIAANVATIQFWVTVLPFPTPVPTEPPPPPTPVPTEVVATEVPPTQEPSPTEEPPTAETPSPTASPSPTAEVPPAEEPSPADNTPSVEGPMPPPDAPPDVDTSFPLPPSPDAGVPVLTPHDPAPTPAAAPTPVRGSQLPDPDLGPAPEPLGMPWPPPPGFIMITGSGPVGDLAAIWGYLDFPISQEYGHTPFSLAHPHWYGYGRALGLDGYAHTGLDVGMPRGTPLYSPIDGTVTVAGGTGYYRFYGNGGPGVGQLSIESDSGDEVILGHMGRITVEAGQRVSVGQLVGLSGGENGDHLHLETRELQSNGGYLLVDPRESFLLKALAVAGYDEGPDHSPGTARTILHIRAGLCAVQANNAIAACIDGARSGVAFTVTNTTLYEKSQVTRIDGQTRFVPKAGQLTISGDGGLFAHQGGAYVRCATRFGERVLFDGWIDQPSLEITTRPGERVICDWYAVPNSPGTGTLAGVREDEGVEG